MLGFLIVMFITETDSCIIVYCIFMAQCLVPKNFHCHEASDTI
jgi:hypothetical protein